MSREHAHPAMRRLRQPWLGRLRQHARCTNIQQLAANDERSVSNFTRSEDTIAAIVTPTAPGNGSVGIVRLSGESATSIASAVFASGGGARRVDVASLPSHTVHYGSVVSPSSGDLLDEVLCVPMRAPRSFTAEDVVEINCHGGSVCCQRVLRACIDQGARFAQPGEFTMRAFLNGRIDLSQAESVQSLINARTNEAASSALDSLRGGLSSDVQAARSKVHDLIAELDARLDFDEDLPPLDSDDIKHRIRKLERELERAIATAERGRLMETGITVAILGKPNAGKSSLLNAWSKSERAIVTEVPGTTRDVVEASIPIGGIEVTLLDTAGIRDAPSDAVETIGVERSRSAASGADVLLMVADAHSGWDSADQDVFESVLKDERGPPALLVLNKTDICRGGKQAETIPTNVSERFNCNVVHASATQSSGIERIEEELLHCCGVNNIQAEGGGWAVNQRQAEALMRARDALQRLEGTLEQDVPTDFWTIELREAAIAMGQVTGEDVSEGVLDVIFSRFCIGK